MPQLIDRIGLDRSRSVQQPNPRVGARARRLGVALLVAVAAVAVASGANAHDQRHPVAAGSIQINTSQDPALNTFSIEITNQDPILLTGDFDPTSNPSAILVYGTGANAGSTGLIELTGLWEYSSEDGYSYSSDEEGPGGVTSVSLRNRELSVSASGANWTFEPTGAQDELWFHFRVEGTWLCARFSTETATQVANEADHLEWTASSAPADCPQPLCGDGVVDFGEACDDGNLDDGDFCNNSCELGLCDVPEFETTFEGIQAVILNPQCVSCHLPGGDAPMLDLRDGFSYDALVDVAPETFGAVDYVEPGEPIASFLWEKIAANTFEDELDGDGQLVRTAVEIVEDLTGRDFIGGPMPVGFPVAPQHLEAIEKWIRAGAPRDLVVPGTSDLLGACLPPHDPLKLDPPPPLPDPGVAVQFQSTAWDLLPDSEDELCYATYYDLTQTDLVPEEAQFDCGIGGVNNPSGKCFYWNRRVLRQDGQSHHSIISFYTGAYDVHYDDVVCTNPDSSDFGLPCPDADDDAYCDSTPEAGDGVCEDRNLEWGPFKFRPNDPTAEHAGMECEPLDIDPEFGFNPDCSGVTVSSVACTGYGPPDHTFQTLNFAGSQEPYTDDVYGSGVYAAIPMASIITWNSHAFNDTVQDTTMAQYLDMHFALTPEEQRHQARGVFAASTIFIQQVPAFEEKEYCSTVTLLAGDMQDGVKVLDISSHLHSHGVEFRIWEPPNEPCAPEGFFSVFTCEPNCSCLPPDAPDQLVYFSDNYTDPAVVEFNPPLELGPSVAERTFKFCAVYENGSSEDGPPVKRQSTSPKSPPFSVGGFNIDIGGPCPDMATEYIGKPIDGVKCMDGPNQGVQCGGEDAETFCETSNGAADGVCDACDLFGGFTTQDEMFIMLGTFFVDEVPEPSHAALQLAALAMLAALRRKQAQQAPEAR